MKSTNEQKKTVEVVWLNQRRFAPSFNPVIESSVLGYVEDSQRYGKHLRGLSLHDEGNAESKGIRKKAKPCKKKRHAHLDVLGEESLLARNDTTTGSSSSGLFSFMAGHSDDASFETSSRGLFDDAVVDFNADASAELFDNAEFFPDVPSSVDTLLGQCQDYQRQVDDSPTCSDTSWCASDRGNEEEKREEEEVDEDNEDEFEGNDNDEESDDYDDDDSDGDDDDDEDDDSSAIDDLGGNDNDRFLVGDRVRVSRSITHPSGGWGFVTPDSVGVVQAVSCMGIVVDFPEHTGWNGTSQDLEKVSFQSLVKGEELQPMANLSQCILSRIGFLTQFDVMGNRRNIVHVIADGRCIDRIR